MRVDLPPRLLRHHWMRAEVDRSLLSRRAIGHSAVPWHLRLTPPQSGWPLGQGHAPSISNILDKAHLGARQIRPQHRSGQCQTPIRPAIPQGARCPATRVSRSRGRDRVPPSDAFGWGTGIALLCAVEAARQRAAPNHPPPIGPHRNAQDAEHDLALTPWLILAVRSPPWSSWPIGSL